jgi:MYXO-CTERM domain-containing protein
VIDEGFDADADGVTSCAGDCDDGDAAVSPALPEALCTGVDEDCDPTTADDPDADGDGAGGCTDCDDADVLRSPLLAEVACNAIDDDCDAATPDVGTEVCDGEDDDCDGVVDEDLPTSAYWPDADGDGAGDADAVPVEACAPPAGHVANDGDCDDTDPSTQACGTSSAAPRGPPASIAASGDPGCSCRTGPGSSLPLLALGLLARRRRLR